MTIFCQLNPPNKQRSFYPYAERIRCNFLNFTLLSCFHIPMLQWFIKKQTYAQPYTHKKQTHHSSSCKVITKPSRASALWKLVKPLSSSLVISSQKQCQKHWNLVYSDYFHVYLKRWFDETFVTFSNSPGSKLFGYFIFSTWFPVVGTLSRLNICDCKTQNSRRDPESMTKRAHF